MNIISAIVELIAAAVVVLGFIILFSAKSLRPFLLAGWDVVRKRKELWLIGIFGGLAAYGGEVNFLARRIYDISNFRAFVTAVRDVVVQGEADEFFRLAKEAFSTAPMTIVMWVLLLLLLAAVIYWLIVVSQGIIIRIAGRLAQNQPTSFIDGVSVASRRFWDMVKIAVIFLLIGWGAWLIVVGIPTMIFFLSNGKFWADLGEIGSYVALIVSFVNLFLVQFAYAASILYDKPAVEAIVHAWRLFRRNVFVTIELSLGLFTVNLLVLVIVAAVLSFFFPVPSPAGFYTIIAVLIFQLGVVSVFTYGATVALFVKLQNASPESKLGQWTQRIVNLATPKKTV